MYAIGITCVQFRSEKPMGYIAYHLPMDLSLWNQTHYNFYEFCLSWPQTIEYRNDLGLSNNGALIECFGTNYLKLKSKNFNLKHCVQIMSKFNSHLDKRLGRSNMLLWLQMHVHFFKLFTFSI